MPLQPALDDRVLVARRRALRHESTPTERTLWRALRDRQLRAIKVRRQHSCGPYILEFYVPAGRLAIEVDGNTHGADAAQSYDVARTAYLARLGIRVVRFTNREVMTELPAVLTAIEMALVGDKGPSP